MFCESYRKSLTDAAARGEALPREMELHVAGCAACSEAFDAERALQAAIGDALFAKANADVPALLQARVRTAVSAGAQGGTAWRWGRIWAPLTVAVGAALLLAIWQFDGRVPEGKTSQVVAAKTEPTGKAAAEVPESQGDPVGSSTGALRVNRTNFRPPETSGTKVSVKASNEKAMLQLIQMVRDRPEVAQAIGKECADTTIAIKPIAVAELSWAPLVEDSAARN